MSSGACRALVATLFTLVATIGLALPVGAQSENLRTESQTVYTIALSYLLTHRWACSISVDS